jgi:hypothetical protein
VTDSQIEKLAYSEPFQPFRLVLQDGEQIIVSKPRKALLSGGQLALVGLTERPNGPGKQGFRIVPIDRIISAGVVDETPKP